MSLARLANIAWDNGDMDQFDRLSCRALDRTIAEMTDAEIVALVTSSPSASPVVNAEKGEMRRPLGRESQA